MLCSEWVPSEWESDKNITIIHTTPVHQLSSGEDKRWNKSSIFNSNTIVLFGLSFWRHPFTAEHPLLRHISPNLMKKQTHPHLHVLVSYSLLVKIVEVKCLVNVVWSFRNWRSVISWSLDPSHNCGECKHSLQLRYDESSFMMNNK